MKSTMTFKSIALITLIGAALAAPVLAQQGPGAGGGWGRRSVHAGQRHEKRRRHGARERGLAAGTGAVAHEVRPKHRPRLDLADPGRAHRLPERMRNVQTYDECVQAQTEHRGLVEVRAKEKGANLMTPRRDMCEMLKARGAIK